MKKIILLLCLPFLGISQVSKIDESKGFKHYMFGNSPVQYKDLSLEIAEGNTKLYSSVMDTLKMNGITFEYVRVTFLNDKLYDISMKTKNSAGTKFLQVLQENYGKPVKTKEQYEWNGKKVHMTYQKENTDAVITLSSKEIKAQAQKKNK